MKENYVYDLEVYPNYTAWGFMNIATKEVRIFEISSRTNNAISLHRFLRQNVKGLIGFNNLNYDSRLIDSFLRTKRANNSWYYRLSQNYVNSSFANPKPLIPQLDLFKILHFDNRAKRTSLKYCEFGLGMKNIQDLPYPFDSTLTSEQMDEVNKYLLNDLKATYKLYEEYKDKIYLRSVLEREYGLPCTNWSDSKIGEELLLSLYCKASGEDPEEISKKRTTYSDTLVKDLLPKYLSFSVPEFKTAYEWMSKQTLTEDNWSLEYKFEHNSIEYVLGLGGIHSSDSGIWRTSDTLLIHDEDVGGYYPSLIRNLKICPKHLDADIFTKVIEEELIKPRKEIYKPGSKNKELHWKQRKLYAAFSDGLKLSANSISGKLKDRHSFCFDPAENARMTISGQLSLLMLMDMIVSKIPEMHFLQSNTDGFTMTYDPKYFNLVKKICNKWEKLTNLELEDAYPKAIYQGNVNNYLWDMRTYAKLKGAYEIDKKVGDELVLNKNSSMKIVAIAVKEYFINNVPIEETITNHNNIFDFCIGTKASKGWKFYYEDDEILNTKVLRYYISNDDTLGRAYKVHEDGRKNLLEAWPSNKVADKDKKWNIQLFNMWEEKKDYNINYEYYFREARKLIARIERNNTN